mmetsp:Transcript_25214/g.83296  ORF Transcript_25214/g.83296 Transcript_25214/m.83296 type:complete len:92 (-) Transcript_25214:2593-2868(-)
MQRVLMEFNSVTEVESLRKCNRTLRTLVDEHPKLWKHVTFSPPGLARLSRHGVRTLLARCLKLIRALLPGNAAGREDLEERCFLPAGNCWL